ncbi:cell division protein FtsK [Streptacidiphilus sp. EB103A]|uniref:cell division protein FtsK n=1 Tax=Streptacidiphilus sp. EB103A TaxID=3156275 RepID=UPI003514809C
MTNPTCPRQTSLPLPLRTHVRLSDPHTRAALDLTTGTVLLGLAQDDTPVVLPDDTTNLMVCAGSGAGTSSTLQTLAAQAAGLGALVDILDPHPATGAHHWGLGLGQVAVHHRVQDIHTRLLDLAHHLDRPAPAHTGGWTGRQVVLVENVATLVQSLRQYWSHTRPETQLTEAPAVTALGQLLEGGPGRGVQVWAGNPTAELPGLPGEVRRLFPARLIGGAGHALWHRAAPEVWAIPAYSSTPGRLHLAADRTLTTLQALYLDHAEARAMARGTATQGETR